MAEQKLIDGKIVLRPRDNGEFDELLMMDGKECRVHAETMDGGTLWIGFYPSGTKDRVSMWICPNSKRPTREDRPNALIKGAG